MRRCLDEAETPAVGRVLAASFFVRPKPTHGPCPVTDLALLRARR